METLTSLFNNSLFTGILGALLGGAFSHFSNNRLRRKENSRNDLKPRIDKINSDWVDTIADLVYVRQYTMDASRKISYRNLGARYASEIKERLNLINTRGSYIYSSIPVVRNYSPMVAEELEKLGIYYSEANEKLYNFYDNIKNDSLDFESQKKLFEEFAQSVRSPIENNAMDGLNDAVSHYLGKNHLS